MEDNPARTITLFCWILDASDRPFSVSIEESRTVERLKQVILEMKRHRLPNVVDSEDLVVWRVYRFFHFDSFVLTILLQGIHRDQGRFRGGSVQRPVCQERGIV
jgi:hypothetical protein